MLVQVGKKPGSGTEPEIGTFEKGIELVVMGVGVTVIVVVVVPTTRDVV